MPTDPDVSGGDWPAHEALIGQARGRLATSGRRYCLSAGPDVTSSWRDPQPEDRRGWRDDRGSGFLTISMRVAEWWRDHEDSELLDLVPALERLELSLREAVPRADDGPSDYTYTLF